MSYPSITSALAVPAALAFMAFAPAPAAAQGFERISFEGIPPGTILSTVTASGGSGPIGVSATNPNLGAVNAAVVFNSSSPTGEDEDLGTPNEDFGGPGIGSGGSAGSPFQNNLSLGKMLIVAEDLVDGDGNGFVDDPDDADRVGAQIDLDFTAIAPVQLRGMHLLDVEGDRPEAVVSFFDGGGGLINSITLPIVGDNGLAPVNFGLVSGVFKVQILLNGSGAIDNVFFKSQNVASIGDTVFCDLDDDGFQDPGDPGIEGAKVNLFCAGPDGQLGTADDITDSQTTDANGMYLFTGLPAGACFVQVDVNSVGDKVPGQCPTDFLVDLQAGQSFLDADFCFITPGQIGDTVFCDEDNDGVQDPGEPGIQGVTVNLACAGVDGMVGTADDFTDSTVTDANGMYLFTGILPDLCEVSVDESTGPRDKILGRCPDRFVVELDAGESFLDADFCFIKPGRIGDTVFCDIDFDGVQDPGEPGIEGVVVNLVCDGPDGQLGTLDDYTDTQTTDANGMYLFEDVPPGDCIATVDPTTAPNDKIPGGCPPDFLITLDSDETFLDADFCFITPPGRIGDFVWCDLDDDGIQDGGEPGIEGVIVNLTCAGIDGVLGTADDFTDSMTTDSNGLYLFDPVPAGVCVVEVDVNSAPNDKIPGMCPTMVMVDLGPDETFLDADFCFISPPPGMIGDFVYCDLDDDGEQDPGEPGIPGVVVDLLCTGPDGVFGTVDDLVDSMVTDANGNYLFDPVPPGECAVAVDVTSAPPDKIPGMCPTSFLITLQPGEAFLDADFCFITPPGEIGDKVYCDLDNDGVEDPGEPGIGGVTVNLTCAGLDEVLGTADDYTDSTVTDANGMYLFTEVPAGDCRVEVDVNTVPDDKIPGECPTVIDVDLQPAESFLDADFCFTSPGEVGDFVWCDLDDDGIQDMGELGIEGAIVMIACGGPDGVIGTADDFTGTMMTDANGLYLFTGVPPGPCEVTVEVDSVPDKVPGTQCPTTITFNLPPAGSFLDADFCFNFGPPADCCENGKPRALTFIYTGEDCDATFHMQDRDKVNCDGDPGFAPTVFIRSTDDEDPTDVSGNIWFEGLVDLGHAWTMDAVLAGEDSFSSASFIHIFDPTGTMLLQTVEFHTSCSQPLETGYQFGASLLVDCIGEDEPVEGDCCADGKPRVLSFQYTGEDCTATSHAQDPDKVSCSGDPGMAATVFIRGTDEENPTDTGGDVWFEGLVDLGSTFDLDAANEGQSSLANATFIHIFDPTGTMLLQTVEFHTSCSQPLFVGNQFGASLLVDCIGEDAPNPNDLCGDGRPAVIFMKYTGEDCGASVTTQDSSKWGCSGDPGFADPVRVFVHKRNDDSTVYFDDVVDLGVEFAAVAAMAGEDKFSTETQVDVFDLSGGLLQSVFFHTSCSQPLLLDDQFGSIMLTGVIPE